MICRFIGAEGDIITGAPIVEVVWIGDSFLQEENSNKINIAQMKIFLNDVIDFAND
jgi:hypothetical protein